MKRHCYHLNGNTNESKCLFVCCLLCLLPFYVSLLSAVVSFHSFGAENFLTEFRFFLTFLKANLSFLLPGIIGSDFKESLNIPEKCFGG